MCPIQQIETHCYPYGFVKFLTQSPEAPWMYTGGLETHPTLIGQLESVRPLWGNNEQAVRAARSPQGTASILKAAGIPYPRIHSFSGRLPVKGRWVLKSRRSTGGRGVSWWNGKVPACDTKSHYLQEYIDGVTAALVFLGDGKGAELLGLTRQLVGEAWLHARPFRYCGSIGPLPMEDRLRRSCEHLGHVLAAGCRLRGLFGVDGVIQGGSFWPVEVNPRYTASVEVIELTAGRSLLSPHVRVFNPSFRGSAEPGPSVCLGIIGKAILFARRAITFRNDRIFQEATTSLGNPFALPLAADIPRPGTPLRAGRPILTLFAQASSVDECLLALKEKAAEVEKLLY
jgi:predicted ATP-grasp superfamily ATP-dependent carboligase